MAKYFSGKVGVITIDDASGTPVDVSRYVRSIEVPEDVEQLDATAFQARARERIPGFSAGAISFGANWTSELFRLLHGIKRHQQADPSATFTYAWGPEGNAAGKVKYTGELVLTAFSREVDLNSPTRISAGARITGANTETAW